MNTNEFYKELMSEYSFDHEKIKKAAMGKSVSKKTSRLKAVWISAASTDRHNFRHCCTSEHGKSRCRFSHNIYKRRRAFQNGNGSIQQS